MKTHCPFSPRMMTFQTFTSGSFQKGIEIFNELPLFINYIKTDFPSQPKKSIAEYVSELSL